MKQADSHRTETDESRSIIPNQPQFKNSLPVLKEEVRTEVYEAGDLLLDYLEQLDIDFVFGIPGGAIEPLYNALARSERRGGIRSIVARHESGAAFMADGYARNSGKLGVCCTTTGPGATNAITGIATAYENKIPLLIITAQTAMADFGKGAFQESADTGINTVGMFEFCTRYNTMVTHVNQLEQKLTNAILTAFSHPRGPVHLSIPLDVLKTRPPVKKPSHDLNNLLATSHLCDEKASIQLAQKLLDAKNPVFVLGNKCGASINTVLKTAIALDAEVITTPDGKGLINPYHPLYRGVIGFAGHKTAKETLLNKNVDLVIAVGVTFGEWNSAGWDKELLMNQRLIQIESDETNLIRSPSAKSHIRGEISAIFDKVFEYVNENSEININRYNKFFYNENNDKLSSLLPFELDSPVEYYKESEPIKPQWLMRQLTKLLPSQTKFLADTGNSFAWAIHYLHPYDRRLSERRATRSGHIERRAIHSGTFQTALEFAPMGWAIGSAIGTSLCSTEDSVTVCITGDGSWLMNGQEITIAVTEKLPIVYIILNDSSLGMVRHGQKNTNAESIGHQLPKINFAMMAESVGAQGYKIQSCRELLNLDFRKLLNNHLPILLDVEIDSEQVPPISVRIDTLNHSNFSPEHCS